MFPERRRCTRRQVRFTCCPHARVLPGRYRCTDAVHRAGRRPGMAPRRFPALAGIVPGGGSSGWVRIERASTGRHRRLRVHGNIITARPSVRNDGDIQQRPVVSPDARLTIPERAPEDAIRRCTMNSPRNTPNPGRQAAPDSGYSDHGGYPRFSTCPVCEPPSVEHDESK